METIGKISRVTDVKIINDKFRKLEFVLSQHRLINDDVYKNDILFQVCNGKIEDFKQFNLGDKIKVFFNIQGLDKLDTSGNNLICYNNLNAYKFELIKKSE